MRFSAAICLAAAAGLGFAQTAPEGIWKPPQTPWGQPDLQGAYTSDDLQGVAVERPAQYGMRRFLTEQELADRAASVGRQKSAIDTGERPKEDFWARVQGLGKVETKAVPPNFVEYARRASSLTSLVSDPPDGRIPAITDEARARRGASYTNPLPQAYLDMTIYGRCITRGGFFPAIYGNGSQFIQTPDTVAIRYETIHETRLIPLDNRPRTKIRSFMGEPRGHWEGKTLVVETTNFIGGKLSISGPPYSEDLVLIERFTRVAPNILGYAVTVDDPKTYRAPWTATFPLTSESGYEIFEYACHEGNYSMRNRLSGARAEETKDAAKEAAGKK